MPSTEHRHVRSGSLNITPQNGHPPNMPSAAPRFEGPRSPPNTSHVPCKFFRQGACQAGSACPFSHDLGASAETICKYFAKGNCKFGPKCANIHILPDGRRINYGKNGVTIGTAPIALGGARGNPPTSTPYHPSTTSALTSGLYRDGVPAYTSAYPNAKDDRTSETLKSLHTSAFGSNEYLSVSNAGLGSSPPSHPVGEEYFGRRTMHSSRFAKPKMLSASLPKAAVDRDWDAEFAFLEEDYVPHNLQELLTPAEKARRGSIRAIDSEPGSENATKFGSPLAGASPSRWGPLFQRQKEEELESRSFSKASAFGHVGSPLRNSVLSNEMSNGLNGAGRHTPGSRSGSDTTSALTQQLSRTRLADDGNGSPRLHPMMAAGRTVSNGAGAIGKERGSAIERHISSGSIGSSGRFTTPIDEEDPAFVFNMEEDSDEQQAARQRKRISAGLGMGGGGSGWSYAGVLSAKTVAPGSSLAKESREPSVTVETVGGR
ncbi:Protein cps3 like protein [Verticillium longisporum]|uniref:Protein cps3 like protein n=1 Tax=Verticillium longisporum TaxID=100787 RepID=A0A8I3AJP0_VERLO|nr:Protein cps3 like protein [Verticillium longisporum]